MDRSFFHSRYLGEANTVPYLHLNRFSGWDHTYYEPGMPGYLEMYHIVPK